MTFALLLQAKSNDYSLLITMGLAFVVMYFFMIRPQQKKQKDQKNFLDELKKGDSVVTIGGLHGKVLEIDELTVVLEVDRGFKLKFDRASISLEGTQRLKKEKEKEKEATTGS